MSGWRHEDDLRELSDALAPDDRALARIRARLRTRGRSRARYAALAVAAVATALALLVLRAAPRDVLLDSPQAWSEAEISLGVDLRFQGRGVAVGPSSAPVIRWEDGEISLAVPKDRGLSLRVQTPEAEVLVVGTRFTVARDPRGTQVSVDEGRVAVTCVDGTARFLDPGQGLACPRSAAATLSVARELRDQGAPAAEVYDLLQRGLARSDADEAVRDELRYLSALTLEQLGRPGEARKAAEEALSSGDPPRWKALAGLAARLAVAEGDCAGALPHLRRLAAEGDDPVALVLLSDCLAPTDPAGAREALEAALRLSPGPEEAARVRARLERL